MPENKVRCFDEERYDVSRSHKLHVYRDDLDSWHHVWLNTLEVDFDGICLAVAKTRKQALTQAVKVLETAIERLQGN